MLPERPHSEQVAHVCHVKNRVCLEHSKCLPMRITSDNTICKTKLSRKIRPFCEQSCEYAHEKDTTLSNPQYWILSHYSVAPHSFSGASNLDLTLLIYIGVSISFRIAICEERRRRNHRAKGRAFARRRHYREGAITATSCGRTQPMTLFGSLISTQSSFSR